MADPYGYWTMFGGPDPDPDPMPTSGGLTSAPAVYHSVITGTFDPTPAEIVAAAAAKGLPVPAGLDPVEYSRMMSGVPPSGVSPTSIPVSTAAIPGPWMGYVPGGPVPSGVPPAMSAISTSPSFSSMPSIPPPSIPLPPAAGGASGSPIAAAMRTLSYDGGGGLLCDPITGKCPQYR